MIDIKYEGYLKKQAKDIERMKALETKQIPTTLNYDRINGLKAESREKFNTYRPKNILEAQKIAGINPTDVSLIMAYLTK